MARQERGSWRAVVTDADRTDTRPQGTRLSSPAAEASFREAHEKSRRALGDRHPDTISYLVNIGSALDAQDKFSEAEACYREALEKRRRALGEEHTETLRLVKTLGSSLRKQGKHQQAIELLAPAVAPARKAFTRGNAPRFAALLSSLGEAQIEAGFDAERFKLTEANLLEAHRILEDAGAGSSDAATNAEGAASPTNSDA